MLTARSPGQRIQRLLWTGLESCQVHRQYLTSNARAPNHRRREQTIKHRSNGPQKSSYEQKLEIQGKPSLLEQLFPEEASQRNVETQPTALRQIPRLPLDTAEPLQPVTRSNKDEEYISARARRLREAMEAEGPQTSVLVMRNVSKNLVDDDFRRIIPKGKHVEGWTLEQGDIIKVIPGRSLETLERENFYYLLFKSALSAFTYQGHVTRLHKLARSHMPASLTSPILPPPGYLVNGVDINDVIENYSLLPPSSEIHLRQLKPPLTPLVERIMKHLAYPSLARRPDRMPFEVRLVLEGPQLQMSTIRQILRVTGKQRALSWTGGEESNVYIKKWEPQQRNVSPLHLSDVAEIKPEGEVQGRHKERIQKRRTSRDVYIVGFHCECDAQTFVRHWHRRPMEPIGFSHSFENGDSAPIVNAEILW